MTYLLGWSVIPQIIVRRERWSGRYRISSIPLVQPGQNVRPDQAVIRIERLKAIEELMTIPLLSLPGVVDPSANIQRSMSASNAQENIQREVLPAYAAHRVVGPGIDE